MGRTAFVSYDRARTYKLESFTFTVNGKNVVNNTKTAVKTELTNPILTYYVTDTLTVVTTFPVVVSLTLNKEAKV